MRALHLLIGLAAACLTALALAGAVSAQEPAPGAAPAEAAGETPPDGETSASSLPAALTDPDIATDELALRMIPLTADDLSALAEAWLGIVRSATQRSVDLQLQIDAAEGAPARDLVERQAQASAERGRLLAKYSAVVDSFATKGGAAEAVAGYRAYRNAILLEETQAADWRTLVTRALNWATDRDGGIALALDAAIILAAFLGLLIVARLVRGGARRWIGRIPNLSKLLQSFLVLVIYWLTIAFGLMIVLSALGIDVTPLFALVGGASFILAFALQDTLANLAAGLMIMINRPFDEGDYVDIAGTAGTVKSVSIVSTTVTTPDNQVIVVPNSKVWGNIITNVTASDTRRVDLVFGIAYGDSIEQAQGVLEEVVGAHPLVLAEPEPVIRVGSLGASSVDFICRPWVRGGDYWTVYWDLTRQVKEAFDRAGITIPFPQTEMHIHVAGGAQALPAEAPFTAAASGAPARGATSAQRYAAGDTAEDPPGEDTR